MTGSIEDNHIFIPDLKGGIYLIEINLDAKKYIDKLVVN